MLRPVVAACIVLAAALGAAACGNGGAERSLTLTIGDLVPLTGEQEGLGPAGKKAASLAEDEIKAAIRKAGVAHRVTVEHEDDKSQSAGATSAARMLIKSHASCVTGAWSTADTLQAASTLLPKGIPIISPAASGDLITPLKDAGFINRTVLPDRYQGTALAELMDRELGGARGKRVNIAAVESTYGKRLIASFGSSWRARGGRIGHVVRYASDKQSLAQEAREMGQDNPDAFVVFDFVGGYLKLAPELLNVRGWTPSKTFASDGLASATIASQPVLSEGLRGVAPGAAKTGAGPEGFAKIFKRTPGPPRQNFDAQNFDAVILCYLAAVSAGSTSGGAIADKIREVSAPPGRKVTWQQLPEAIRTLENGLEIDYQGASGPIDMDDRGDPTAGVYDSFRVRKNKLQVYGQITLPLAARSAPEGARSVGK